MSGNAFSPTTATHDVRKLEAAIKAEAMLGATARASDFAFVIDGFESLVFKTKQAPWPVVSVGDPVEYASTQGTKGYTPGAPQYKQESPISFNETIGNGKDAPVIDAALREILRTGGTFDAVVYMGTPEKFTWAKPLYCCSIKLDTADRNWDDNTTPLTISGTMTYYYFGNDIKGNSGNPAQADIG